MLGLSQAEVAAAVAEYKAAKRGGAAAADGPAPKVSTTAAAGKAADGPAAAVRCSPPPQQDELPAAAALPRVNESSSRFSAELKIAEAALREANALSSSSSDDAWS